MTSHASNSPPLAIFDLDGTLTTRDSFVAYLLTFGWRKSRHQALATMPFLLAAHLGRIMKDYRLKQKLIANFVAGADPKLVTEHNAWFCEHWLPRHLHPVGHRLLQGHLRLGHRVILLSASPEIYVPQVAQTLGIKEVVCTRVKQAGGKWLGELDGNNCKGPEKLIALKRHLNVVDRPANSYSYGDSKSDLDILSWVEYGAWIQRRDFNPVGQSPRSAFPLSDR